MILDDGLATGRALERDPGTRAGPEGGQGSRRCSTEAREAEGVQRCSGRGEGETGERLRFERAEEGGRTEDRQGDG